MKKDEIIEIFLELWRNTDQVGYDKMIEEAFQNCPTQKLTEFIEIILGDDSLDSYCDKETLDKAKRLIGID